MYALTVHEYNRSEHMLRTQSIRENVLFLSVDYELRGVSHECQGQDEQEEQAGGSLH